MIPYVSDEEADAANKNPHLKLLWRLVGFKVLDDGQHGGHPASFFLSDEDF